MKRYLTITKTDFFVLYLFMCFILILFPVGGLWYEYTNTDGKFLLRPLQLLVFFSLFIFILNTSCLTKLDMMIFSIILYRGYYVFIDFLQTDLYTTSKDFLYLIQIYLLFMSLKKIFFFNYEAILFKTLHRILTFLIYCNFFSIIVFPDGVVDPTIGWNKFYFLGFKNTFTYYYILWYVITCELRIIENKKCNFHDHIILILMLVSSFYVKASTCFAVIFFLSTFTLLKQHLLFLFSLISLKRLLLIIFTLSLIITFGYGVFDYICNCIFNTSITFSGRDKVWRYAVDSISQSWLIGNGNTDLKLGWGWLVGHAHNKILDIIYVGGIPLLSFFIYLVFNFFKSSIKSNNNHKILIYFFIFSYGLVFLMEGVRFTILEYISLFCLYFASKKYSVITKSKHLTIPKMEIKNICKGNAP